MSDISSLIIRIYGIVQGVGFRPFVSRTAEKFGVCGNVSNKGSYVEIHAQSDSLTLEKFIAVLKSDAPERSSILKVDVTKEKLQSYKDFKIIDSEKESGDIFVSPDIATCDKCKAELFDKSNRRYLHPFINCTACGPRLTILDSMPYDRERTSMGEFPMCKQCENEYTHPETRRYDAQPVCCNDCGPNVYIIGKNISGAKAITFSRHAIMEGKIIAVKGIGGFHLCCDAKNKDAVLRLRKLKNRPTKPFAVMFRNLETVKENCHVLKEQEEILDGHQKPIILLKKKQGSSICGEIAPENPTIGALLPYAPIQMLLFKYDDDVKMTDCLVMTSGNVSGAPICRSDDDAVREISGFCDAILSHNRKIRLRADDSVMDFYNGSPYMIRRSRGYAPLPFMLSNNFRGNVLGIGGELKNTFCIGKNNLFYPSPYVGDMADIRTVNALRESVKRMQTLLEATPTIVACDLHPKYNTTAVAEEFGLPLIKVQHHYAHIVSCMAENDYSGNVIGVAFDGTGYGIDETIWGGEFLVASFKGFERLGSITPFSQIGGDSSSKEGYRIAASMISSIYGDDAESVIKKLQLCSKEFFNMQSVMQKRKINCVTSTSAGRLFDAVSAVLNIKKQSTFEGEASTALMFLAEKFYENNKNSNYDYSNSLIADADCGDKFKLRTDSLFKFITDSAIAGKNADELAFFFHSVLADMIVRGCEFIRDKRKISVCALSGGVFQNRLLVGLCNEKLQKKGFRVLLHSLVPPNDGGIALGQAVAAMYKINNN